MKVQKYEISRTIDKLKSIVQKNDQFPALGGVLVKDGYLIASNTEMTMQLKLEASKGSCFIIPKTRSKRISGKPLTPYERTRAQVAATGNRWAMENFYATHS